MARIDDLYNVEGKAELVDGMIVCDSPTGGLPGFAAGEIFASLRAYARDRDEGHAIPDNVGFIVDLPGRQSFSPDAAFHIGALTMEFARGAPIFAVEVRSRGDYGDIAEARILRKRDDYFSAGTLVVWDVDLLAEDIVRVHRAGRPPESYTRHQHAHAEPALPGWTFPVSTLFPPDRPKLQA